MKNRAVAATFILFSLLLILLISSRGSIDIEAYQGSTAILRLEKLNPQVNICTFGKYFSVVNERLYIIPVSIDQKPGRYPIKFCDPTTKEEIGGISSDLVIIKSDFAIITMSSRLKEYGGSKSEEKLKEEQLIADIYSQKKYKPILNKNFRNPLLQAEIAIGFGVVTMYVDGPRINQGIDFKAPSDSDVFAIGPGKIVLAGKLKFSGNTVIIDHGRGIFSSYQNLERISVNKKVEVSPDTKVGRLGNIGDQDRTDFHLEVVIDKIKVDPLEFIFKINRYIR